MKQIDNAKQLGILIYETRKSQNLTQAELAATSSVGVRFIRELEKGKESCHLGKTLMVLSMLGLQVMVDGESVS